MLVRELGMLLLEDARQAQDNEQMEPGMWRAPGFKNPHETHRMFKPSTRARREATWARLREGRHSAVR